MERLGIKLPTYGASGGNRKTAGATARTKSAEKNTTLDEVVAAAQKAESYISAQAFVGSIPEYVFRRGEKGLGYYCDEACAPHPSPAPPPDPSWKHCSSIFDGMLFNKRLHPLLPPREPRFGARSSSP